MKGPRGAGTRPTSDKVKGAIFSMLENLLAARQGSSAEGIPPEAVEPASIWSGLRLLDLYAGTGALGIEGLSRGAEWADFVDTSPACQRLIRENLELTKLSDHGRSMTMKAEHSLSRLAVMQQDGPYDVVLVDAPYGDPSLVGTLESLGSGEILSPEALVVVEHSRRAPLAEAYGVLQRLRQRRHGDTEVSIYGKPGGGNLGTRDLSGQV